jgi:hypothetical protein
MKIIVLLTCTLILFSCTKEQVRSHQSPIQDGKQICDLGVTTNISKRSQKKRPGIVIDSTQPRPGGTLLIDFDGHVVENTSWNVGGAINCSPSGLTIEEQQTVMNRIRYHFSNYNVSVTTNESTYNLTPATKRQRIIVTETYEWYGGVVAGGTSFLNTFYWNDNTPAFVFSVLLDYNTLKIGEAVTHEIGHTIGLRHQVDCLEGSVVNQYSAGKIMGQSYYVQYGIWNIGPDVLNCRIVDEPLHLKNTFGLL